MSETLASIVTERSAQGNFDLQARIDALQSGDCTEAEFMREVLPLRDSVWAIIALVDQRYRRGLLPEEIFSSVKSKLARHALEQGEYGRTVELKPATGASPTTEVQSAQFRLAAAPTAAPVGRVPVDLTQAVPATDATPSGAPSFSSDAPTKNNLSSPAIKTSDLLRDRYVLESLLGQGGMGTVYKASDRHRADLPQKGRHVALKILNANTMARPGVLADLRREFYCAQALAHPNIVKVYELYCEEEPAFYTMELLEGQLLSDVMERQRPLPLERAYAFAIIQQVGAALVHAHSRNVVHGDLKPHNIMITDADEVRILDFGASGAATQQWATSDALQRNRAPAVTLAYTCCELLDGQQTDPRDDLYALACLSYEMLAGEHPFQRLRSTEARDLGMRPARPPELADRQWHALELGLSWRREIRSISVRDWLAMLGLEPVAERLRPLLPHKVISARSWRPRAVHAGAVIVALIAGLSVWAAFHAKHVAKALDKPVALETHSNPPRSAPATADNPVEPADISALSPLAAIGLDAKLAPKFPEPASYTSYEQPAVEPATTTVKLSDSRQLAENQITLFTDTYRLPSGEAFAEIMVRRFSASRANGSFVWWTEAGSALPGRDFVAQGRTRQLFLNKNHLAKLYIRIVPNLTRTRTETFYVRIGEPGAGYSLGTVTRAAILIPPLLAARNAGASTPSRSHAAD
jgi:serine/threonine protein kinase